MHIGNVIPIAVTALMRNKTRSFLTTLGVIIGVASVISMVAVGEGAKARVSGVFAAMGTNMLIVLSGSTSMGGVSGGFGRVTGLVLSLAILQLLSSGLNLLQANAFLTRAIWGIVLILVMVINNFSAIAGGRRKS